MKDVHDCATIDWCAEPCETAQDLTKTNTETQTQTQTQTGDPA